MVWKHGDDFLVVEPLTCTPDLCLIKKPKVDAFAYKIPDCP